MHKGERLRLRRCILSQNFCSSFLPCLGNSCGSVVSGPASAAFRNSVIVQWTVVYFSFSFNLAFKKIGYNYWLEVCWPILICQAMIIQKKQIPKLMFSWLFWYGSDSCLWLGVPLWTVNNCAVRSYSVFWISSMPINKTGLRQSLKYRQPENKIFLN